MKKHFMYNIPECLGIICFTRFCRLTIIIEEPRLESVKQCTILNKDLVRPNILFITL